MNEELKLDSLPETAPLASPCIRVCCLDDADICLGCFRTLEEIKGWLAADNMARTIVLKQCEHRRGAHDRRFPGPSATVK